MENFTTTIQSSEANQKEAIRLCNDSMSKLSADHNNARERAMAWARACFVAEAIAIDSPMLSDGADPLVVAATCRQFAEGFLNDLRAL